LYMKSRQTNVPAIAAAKAGFSRYRMPVRRVKGGSSAPRTADIKARVPPSSMLEACLSAAGLLLLIIAAIVLSAAACDDAPDGTRAHDYCSIRSPSRVCAFGSQRY
jgi:hypothetical protein